MSNGRLQNAELAAIEALLNEGRLEEAQHLLATLPEVIGTESERVYFTTRLLFQRGRLGREGVVERLGELLFKDPDFPEAERVLQAVERGEPPGEAHPDQAQAEDPTYKKTMPSSSLTERGSNPIPRAPLVPRFASPEERALQRTPLTPSSNLGTLPSEHPPSRPPLPLVPSLELPAQRGGSIRPAAERAGALYSTIPSPELRPGPEKGSSRSSELQPTLIDIANALDRGRPSDALALVELAQPSPELSLLKARSLARLGDTERSELELAKLLRAPLLEPALRSAVARLLIELGFPDRALEQARRALSEDPKNPAARVTCAWALLRAGQRGLEPRQAREVEPLLSSVRVHDPAIAGLLPALRAWVSLQRGDATRALSLAQNALAHDPKQPDALAALAMAAAKLGLSGEAERAIQTLNQVAPTQARALRTAMHNSDLAERRTDPVATASEASVADLFGHAETALVHGRSEVSILGFEKACGDRLRSLSRRGGGEAWPPLAAAAARLFTELPVLRHFAPYDCSIFSIDRLAAAFDVLYGTSDKPWIGDEASLLLIGAYYGESLRQAFGGEWQGSPDTPRLASVEAMGMSVRPCERVEESLRTRQPLSFDTPARLHPGADPFGNSVPLSLVPPAPWDPEAWPPLHRVSEIGRLLPESIVGLYSARTAGRLDHSVSGLTAIDRYVNLLAPSKAPPALDAGWALRVAVLLGAYIGEVLIRAVGARWVDTDRQDGPGAYRIELRDGSQTTPIARALDRLSGRRVGPLSDYVSRVLGGRATMIPPG